MYTLYRANDDAALPAKRIAKSIKLKYSEKFKRPGPFVEHPYDIVIRMMEPEYLKQSMQQRI
jgi:hypothetical protein